MARITLTPSGLPPTYWVESVKNAVYIRNRLPDAGGLAHLKSYLAVFLLYQTSSVWMPCIYAIGRNQTQEA
jgi:hypothetical protein